MCHLGRDSSLGNPTDHHKVCIQSEQAKDLQNNPLFQHETQLKFRFDGTNESVINIFFLFYQF